MATRAQAQVRRSCSRDRVPAVSPAQRRRRRPAGLEAHGAGRSTATPASGSLSLNGRPGALPGRNWRERVAVSGKRTHRTLQGGRGGADVEVHLALCPSSDQFLHDGLSRVGPAASHLRTDRAAWTTPRRLRAGWRCSRCRSAGMGHFGSGLSECRQRQQGNEADRSQQGPSRVTHRKAPGERTRMASKPPLAWTASWRDGRGGSDSLPAGESGVRQFGRDAAAHQESVAAGAGISAIHRCTR